MPNIVINAVGDISFGDHPICVGFGVQSSFRKKANKDLPATTKNLLTKADIVFGNLECVLSSDGIKNRNLGNLQMRGDKEFVNILVESRFTILNVANNHMMQHGEDHFSKTINLLKENNIKVCGLASDKFTLIRKNDIKIGFLGYSMRPRQYFTKQPLYCEGTEETILNDIKIYKKLTDCLITSLHWGEEFIEKPSPEEIRIARNMIDSGADLIIGHHPHVLRGIESYKNGLIAYSMGNFICDMTWEEKTRECIILTCIINKCGIEDYEFTPLYVNNDYLPAPCNPLLHKKLISKINRLSYELKHDNLENYDIKLKHYFSDAHRCLQIHRLNSYKHFIKNIFRYKPIILFEIIFSALARKIQTVYVRYLRYY